MCTNGHIEDDDSTQLVEDGKKRRSILHFVKGIDLSDYQFDSDRLPAIMTEMNGLRWLSLSSTGILSIPTEIQSLATLERLNLSKNLISQFPISDLLSKSRLPHLSEINARYNKLDDNGIPDYFFKEINQRIRTIDLSHNKLTQLPKNIASLTSLLILNISHNFIEVLPPELFTCCITLQHLDASYNKLKSLPVQFLRLSRLVYLDLSYNPLHEYSFRRIFERLNKLRYLNLANTGRIFQTTATTNNNATTPHLTSPIPTSSSNNSDVTIQGNLLNLDKLIKLSDLDLSYNTLSRIPNELFKLTQLRRINLGHCGLREISSSIENWQYLSTLDLSSNNLSYLPHTICNLSHLKRLFVSDNKLQMEGIPKNIGDLTFLESFIAARNQLVSVPASLFLCQKLKNLILTSNRLLTLPEGVTSIPKLNLNLADNPNLVLQPKTKQIPADPFKQANVKSGVVIAKQKIKSRRRRLTQLGSSLISGDSVESPQSKMGLLRQPSVSKGEPDSQAVQVLKGLVEVADIGRRENQDYRTASISEDNSISWEDKFITKQALDYTNVFEDIKEIGVSPGMSIWVIDRFRPTYYHPDLHGTFYTGDCYIVLWTYKDHKKQLNWDIFYWIGNESSLDKKALSAMHSVHLRNLLGAKCRTKRIEMGDETNEFVDIFSQDIIYLNGGHASSLKPVYNEIQETRIFRTVPISSNGHLIMIPVAISYTSLDSCLPHIVEVPQLKIIFIWVGKSAGSSISGKAHLLAEDMNRCEYKGKAKQITVYEGKEQSKFWDIIDSSPPEGYTAPVSTRLLEVKPPNLKLFCVQLQKNSLELPQMRFSGTRPPRKLLDTKLVYILDCHTQVFLWQGRKSYGILRNAGHFLADEILALFPRPPQANTRSMVEGQELVAFKCYFSDFDKHDVIPNYTLSSSTIPNVISNPNTTDVSKVNAQKIDISALFQERNMSMNREKYRKLKESLGNLIRMECFILRGNLCIHLPQHDKGQFYSGECYVFVADCYEDTDDDIDNDDFEQMSEERFEVRIVYFWQGKDASPSLWNKFQLKDFFVMMDINGKREKRNWEDFIGPESDYELIYYTQQSEEFKFLAHFGQKIIIHKGLYNPSAKSPLVRLYQIRTKYSRLCRRIVQVSPAIPRMLNSEQCCILLLSFPDTGGTGMTYVWQGRNASQEEKFYVEQMGRVLTTNLYGLQVVEEGNEPHFFWSALGGKPHPGVIEDNIDYLRKARLFKCTNDRGFFRISEILLDFHQGDLKNDDVMLLDTGEHLFIWFGSQSTDSERIFALRACNLYLKHLEQHETELNRTLKFAKRGKEPWEFKKCFHGWDDWKN